MLDSNMASKNDFYRIIKVHVDQILPCMQVGFIDHKMNIHKRLRYFNKAVFMSITFHFSLGIVILTSQIITLLINVVLLPESESSSSSSALPSNNSCLIQSCLISELPLKLFHHNLSFCQLATSYNNYCNFITLVWQRNQTLTVCCDFESHKCESQRLYDYIE